MGVILSFLDDSSHETQKTPYELGGVISVGLLRHKHAYCYTTLGLDRTTRSPVIVRVYNKRVLLDSGRILMALRERDFFLLLQGERFIAKTLTCIHNSREAYIVFDASDVVCTLHDVMKLRGRLKESEARFVFTQVVVMLKRIHSHYHLVHRNLHPRHIWMLKSGYLVLGNLSLCRPLEEGHWEKLNGPFGQYPYIAPEVLAPDVDHPLYDHLVDLFPLGVLLFSMLTDQCPFDDREGLINCEVRYELLSSSLSEDCLEVITGLLAPADARWSVNDCLQSNWLSGVCVEHLANHALPSSFHQPKDSFQVMREYELNDSLRASRRAVLFEHEAVHFAHWRWSPGDLEPLTYVSPSFNNAPQSLDSEDDAWEHASSQRHIRLASSTVSPAVEACLFENSHLSSTFAFVPSPKGYRHLSSFPASALKSTTTTTTTSSSTFASTSSLSSSSVPAGSSSCISEGSFASSSTSTEASTSTSSASTSSASLSSSSSTTSLAPVAASSTPNAKTKTLSSVGSIRSLAFAQKDGRASLYVDRSMRSQLSGRFSRRVSSMPSPNRTSPRTLQQPVP